MALRVIDYPRRGKSGLRHWLPSWRLVASTLIAFVLLVTGGAWAVYASIDVPPINESVTQQHLTVLDDQGVVLGRRGPEIRQDVPLAQVPAMVQDSFLSAEDRNFWSDGAISVTGTARALLNDLGGGSTQGGSTITQQYVKNAYLSDQRTLSRKVKEAVIALKISQQQSKQQILQGYLNTVYFGRGASGIEMGARAWFDKDVGQLTVAEGAVMAALVNAPSYYELATKDPQAQAKLQARWNYVLDGLVKMGKLSAADRAAQQFPTLAAWPRAGSQSDNQDPYLVEAAISEAEQKTGLTREQLVTGGYTIHTTFDAKMQDAAAAAVQAQITSQLNPAKRSVDANVHASIATVVPGDGAVRVLYGGDDYSKQAFNASWQGTLSPGSSFKTFALAAYLQNGGTVNDTFDGDSPYHVPGNSTTVIPNEGGTSYGQVSVQYALNQSINTVFVEMGQQIGMTKVADAARAAGIPVAVKDQSAPSLPLGVVATNPEQMAGAYATFAAHGQQVAPYTVTSVDQGGKPVYAHQKQSTQAFTPLIADEVTQALQGVVTNGSGGGAQLTDGRDVAGKTGTTDLPGDGTKLGSVWFVGYTPTLSTAVAVWGQTEGGALTSINGMAGKDTVGGGAVAAPLWSAYMSKAVAGTPAQQFTFTAQNNQAVPMNPVSPTGGASGTGGPTTPEQNPTGLPSPPAPTSTYQPPPSTPSTTPSSTGGGGTTTSGGPSSPTGPTGPTATGPSKPTSSGPSLPTGPSGRPSTSGGVTGGPLLPQSPPSSG